MKSFEIKGEARQVALGARLAGVVGAKAMVFLQGDLGAGKTTLVRGFLQARGHKGNVKSPTYTLVEPYLLATGNCYHLDLYRLGDGEELEYLGLREMLDEQAVLLVEWPERAGEWLPQPDLVVSIAHRGDSRLFRIEAGSPAGGGWLSALSVEDLV